MNSVVVEQIDLPVHVVGQDIDRDLVRSLTPGDVVLAEINGCRAYSAHPCPLVSDKVWTVVSNSEEELVLRHPSVKSDVVLSRSNMLEGSASQPAVYSIQNKDLFNGPLYVILQLVAYRKPWSEVDSEFKPAYNADALLEVLKLPDGRELVCEKIHQALKNFKVAGWGYKSLCRFALRSNVRAKTIEAFRSGDYEAMEKTSNEDLLKITKEMAWLKYLVQAHEAVPIETAA